MPNIGKKAPQVAVPVRSPVPLRVPLSPMVAKPRTPLVIPNICATKMTPRKHIDLTDDPWLPPKVEGAGCIKIAAITPIGTIALVPTCDVRPPTPRKVLPATPTRMLQLRVVDPQTGEPVLDPIMSASVYLNCTKPEDQDYNHVANRMKAISEAAQTSRTYYITELRGLPSCSGIVSARQFEDLLSIYENNQVFYQDRIDDKTMSADDIKRRLTELEWWFMKIIEPRPHMNDVDSWIEREKFKTENGRTSYCDTTLYEWVDVMPESHLNTIIQHHKQLF